MFLLRKQQLDLVSLYLRGGKYADVNVQGMIAFFVPVALTLLTIMSGHMSWFYNYGWFTGSITGAAIYYLLKVKRGADIG